MRGICQISNTDYTAYCVDAARRARALRPLADEPARGDADHVVDDAVAHGEHAVVKVHAAAGVVRDDLQVVADGGPLVEGRDVDVAVLLVDVREVCAPGQPTIAPWPPSG